MLSNNIIFKDKEVVELVLENVPNPGPKEILCKAEMSLISIGTEIASLRGEFEKGTHWESYVKYPFHPGYSMVAEVVAIGQEVTRWQVGDRLTSLAEHRQYFVLDEYNAFPVPDGISNVEATWATLARTTQVGVRRAQLTMGEVVAIIGMGVLGQLVTQYARICGAKRIIAIDKSAARLTKAKENGATDILQMDALHVREEIARLTNNKMVDVVFDVTGNSDVLAVATGLLRQMGRLVVLGDSTTPSQQSLGPKVLGDSISILCIHGMMYPDSYSVFNPWTAEEMTSLFFDFISQGKMTVSNLVTGIHSPEQASDVYRGLMNDRSEQIGVLFDWTKMK
ncbi:zinc-dependent alcohol dehydrogenase [Paenibacillus alvei]|uniref:zinc-dependent alcohol dehydrogenase n=1 Tax=Paenibacillus alvei TaxID=44250 RepID=UPI0003866604|nr:zinc-binding dehydrogenase [Paenibacillus alvei]EPY14039.1 alcohol dehydrogenase zinc-binding domain protein [Paenibacillus alvei A6-6i-x]